MAELDPWTMSYRGLVIGGEGSPISIVQVDGLLSLPDVRSSDMALLQRDGLLAGEDYLGGRTVTLTLEVYGKTDAEFLDALSRVQEAFATHPAETLPSVEDRLRFRFPHAFGGLTAYVDARVRRRSAPLDLNFALRAATVVVELFASSHLIKGDAGRTFTTRSRVLPETVDPTGSLVQVGTVIAMPTFCVVSNGVNPRLYGTTHRGAWSMHIKKTGTLSVNFATGVVTLGGVPVTGADLVITGFVPAWRYGSWPVTIESDNKSAAATVTLIVESAWI